MINNCINEAFEIPFEEKIKMVDNCICNFSELVCSDITRLFFGIYLKEK